MTRTVDHEASAYLKAVGVALQERCGVSYVELYKDLHQTLDALREAHARGMSADGFAEAIRSTANLATVGEGAALQDVREDNLRRAALLAFMFEGDTGWKAGVDGGIYARSTGDEVIRIAPYHDHRGWGFSADRLRSGNVDLTGGGSSVLSIDEDVTFDRIGVGLDIVDLVEKYDLSFDAEAPVSRPGL